MTRASVTHVVQSTPTDSVVVRERGGALLTPAQELYAAWNTLYRISGSRFSQPPYDADTFPYYDGLYNRNYRYRYHHLDRTYGIEPHGVDENGEFIFAFGRIASGFVNNVVFYIDAKGNFQLGTNLRYDPRAYSVFDRIAKFTFLGTAGPARERIWFYTGLHSTRTWLNRRDWREHILYFSGARFYGQWMRLTPVGTTWQAEVTPGQDADSPRQEALLDEYRDAEAYYAKWRKKYYKQSGIPDPQKPLNRTDIETRDYLEQHLRVYEPAKARLLTRVTGG